MRYYASQVLNGLMNYVDSEVMGKLPTSGKWVVGTAVNLMTNKAQNVIDTLSDNEIVKMLGIVDEEGMIDIDELLSAMKTSADRYGVLSVDVPLIGRLSFSSSDVDSLKNYIR